MIETFSIHSFILGWMAGALVCGLLLILMKADR